MVGGSGLGSRPIANGWCRRSVPLLLCLSPSRSQARCPSTQPRSRGVGAAPEATQRHVRGDGAGDVRLCAVGKCEWVVGVQASAICLHLLVTPYGQPISVGTHKAPRLELQPVPQSLGAGWLSGSLGPPRLGVVSLGGGGGGR